MNNGMAEERSSPIEGQSVPAADGNAAAQWQRTLWAMVGIQFVMTAAFSMLSPIMPLFLPELGVGSASAVALWAGILAGTTSFVAASARCSRCGHKGAIFTNPSWVSLKVGFAPFPVRGPKPA
jgi:hypothetical protein